MPRVTIKGAVRNVLYIATMNDRVYAFDADNAAVSPLWTTDFTSPPSVTPVPVSDIVGGNLDIVGNVGIESTPVIDRAAGTIYLVARTKENGSFKQRLHALDITTGLPRIGSPTTITATVPGSAPDSTVEPSGRMITFNPKMEQQRAALAISNGVVLVSWAGHHDLSPYHGWVMGFDTTTLRLVGAFAVTPDVDAGESGRGGARRQSMPQAMRIRNRQWQVGRRPQLRRFTAEVQREPDSNQPHRLFHAHE